MSQLALAREADIGLETVKRVEKATVSPSIDVLISISQALGMYLHDLVHDEAITTSDQGERHSLKKHPPPDEDSFTEGLSER